MLFDSHCHLTDERFAEDLPETLERARTAGVVGMVTIASDVPDARGALLLADRHDDVWTTAGIHPHVAEEATGKDRDSLPAILAREPVVAVGETGLDYHYDNSPRAVQRELFEFQVALAAETGLPVVVHSRDADEDTAAVLRNAAPGVRGVLHCFAGGRDLLETGLELGWYVSFAGLVTFDGYDDGELVRAVPLDRLLVETDSPYLAPVPRRGRRNEPAYVEHTARRLAELRGESFDELAEATTRNAAAFYGLDLDGEPGSERVSPRSG